MKQSYFHHVTIIFSIMMMCISFTANAQESNDPPAGWDRCYFNMGRAEYCSTSFEGENGYIQFDLYKDGMYINISFNNGNPKSCNLTIGTMKMSCKADKYGDLYIKLKDKKTIDSLAESIAENGTTAELEYGGHTQTIRMDNQATKNMVKALQWIRNNPIALEM